MKCPHCLESFFETWKDINLMQDRDGFWNLSVTQCPACERMILKKQHKTLKNHYWTLSEEMLIHPIGIARAPLPNEIPEKYSKPYKQASNVLPLSPEASAALSRRCLQDLLRDKAGIKKGDLSDEIQQVLDSKQLPSYLADDLDAVRNIGNFATHPNKIKTSGEIVDVEPKEAEWTLNVLEGLFDFYFVEAEKARKRREALNDKLKDAGKPPMKQK